MSRSQQPGMIPESAHAVFYDLPDPASDQKEKLRLYVGAGHLSAAKFQLPTADQIVSDRVYESATGNRVRSGLYEALSGCKIMVVSELLPPHVYSMLKVLKPSLPLVVWDTVMGAYRGFGPEDDALVSALRSRLNPLGLVQ
jgi:hypothetical protein